MSQYSEIQKLLGADAESFLGFNSPKIKKEQIHQPRADWVDYAFSASDRNNRVLANLQRLYGSGRLANTGYVSILPVTKVLNTLLVPLSQKILFTSMEKIL
jgi:class I fructose-bisphosphate aldolase